MKTTANEIKTDIEGAIDNIFTKYQDIEGIKSGDISPRDAWELSEIEKGLSDLIYRILSFQK